MPCCGGDKAGKPISRFQYLAGRGFCAHLRVGLPVGLHATGLASPWPARVPPPQPPPLRTAPSFHSPLPPLPRPGPLFARPPPSPPQHRPLVRQPISSPPQHSPLVRQPTASPLEMKGVY